MQMQRGREVKKERGREVERKACRVIKEVIQL